MRILERLCSVREGWLFLLLIFVPLLVVCIYILFPGSGHRTAGPDVAHRFVDGIVDHSGALLVCVVVGGPVSVNTKAGGLPGGIDVGTQEDKLPSVLFLLLPDHPLESFVGILAAGIFHTVGGDNKEGLFRSVLFPGVLVDIAM